MTSQALLAIKCIFDSSWALFTSWLIPGTNFTPAQFFMFFMLTGLAIKHVIVPLLSRTFAGDLWYNIKPRD